MLRGVRSSGCCRRSAGMSGRSRSRCLLCIFHEAGTYTAVPTLTHRSRNNIRVRMTARHPVRQHGRSALAVPWSSTSRAELLCCAGRDRASLSMEPMWNPQAMAPAANAARLPSCTSSLINRVRSNGSERFTNLWFLASGFGFHWLAGSATSHVSLLTAALEVIIDSARLQTAPEL